MNRSKNSNCKSLVFISNFKSGLNSDLTSKDVGGNSVTGAVCQKAAVLLVFSLLCVSSSIFAQWENLSDFTESESEVEQVQGVGEPTSRVELKKKEFFRAINDAALNADIDANYQAIQELLAQGNAFNIALAEQYLNYGLLLREAGRLDEAQQALVDAMHIQKVNYGLYDVRHRTILKMLFDFNFEREKPLRAEEYLSRLVLLEEQLGTPHSQITFDMLIRMGHYYIDAYLWTSSGTDEAIARITVATRYFRKSLEEFKGMPMSERLLPYGEYAYSEFLLSIETAKKSAVSTLDFNRNSSNLDQRAQRARMNNMRSRQNATQALELFLTDAQAQANLPMVVRALISLGDLNQMSGRSSLAKRFYKKAWDAAQSLSESDPQRVLLSEVHKLPNYLFSKEWTRAEHPEKSRLEVPVMLALNPSGKIEKVDQVEPQGRLNNAVFARVRRALLKYSFRPRIIDGDFVSTNSELYNAELLVDKRWLERLIEKNNRNKNTQEEESKNGDQQ